ncbi:MAG: polysaccharide deacetylase family protein [Lyngbya sp.]|nr:polysaccharide deacetylase family protein [Lyngbya sp.]
MQFAPFFPVLHPILKTAFPNCLWTGDINQPEIALTFDDGPHPVYTSDLLKVLDQYQIKASFFWLGCWVKHYPQIAKAVIQKGHWICLHGYYHQMFHQMTDEQLKQDLEKTKQEILKICDINPKTLIDVRPPNGVFTPKTLTLLKQWGYRPVMWTVVPEDWVRPGINLVTNRVIQQTTNGSIIVLHDGNDGGQDVAASAKEIIPKLLEKGYKFVTIEQLWQQKKLSV